MEREDQVYDRGLFLEVIGSFPAIIHLRSADYNGIHSQFYQGLSGNVVMVDTSDLDDDITFSEGSGLLKQLGIGDLVDTLFPPITKTDENQEFAILEDGIMKEEALKGL